MNEQPANGRRDDNEDALMVLEVSRNTYCAIVSACGLTTFDDKFPILLIICQVSVVLFIIVDSFETIAGML